MYKFIVHGLTNQKLDYLLRKGFYCENISGACGPFVNYYDEYLIMCLYKEGNELVEIFKYLEITFKNKTYAH